MDRELARNRSAALLLPLAVKTFFPFSHTRTLSADSHGFTATFVLSSPWLEAHEALVEEALRALIREDEPIIEREMVPISAGGLLAKEGEPYLAEEALDGEGLLDVPELKGVHTLLSPPFLPRTKEIGSLYLVFSGKERELVISGRAFPSPQEVKLYKKKVKEGRGKEFLSKGREQGLFELIEENLIWKQKGILLREAIRSYWREQVKALGAEEIDCGGFEEGSSLLLDRKKRVCLATWEEGQAEPPFTAAPFDLLSCWQNGENVLPFSISLLQLMIKILKLFAFDWSIYLIADQNRSWGKNRRESKEESLLKQVLETASLPYLPIDERGAAPRIELRVRDYLDREWALSSLDLLFERGEFLIEASLIGSLYRFIALAVERGSFPEDLLQRLLREK